MKLIAKTEQINRRQTVQRHRRDVYRRTAGKGKNSLNMSHIYNQTIAIEIMINLYKSFYSSIEQIILIHMQTFQSLTQIEFN